MIPSQTQKTEGTSAEGMSFQQSIRQCIHSVSPATKYQNKLIVFVAATAFTLTLQVFSSMLFYMNPVFLCEGSKGKLYQEEACPQIEFCSIVNTETITAEMHVYCDSRKADRTLLQSGLGIGFLIGLMIAAWGDRFGKKLCLCLGLFLLNLTWIFMFLGVHLGNTTLLFLGEIISGISNKMVYVSFMVILTRFMKREGYELGTLVWYITFHGMGQTVLSGLNAVFEDWRIIAFIFSVAIVACSVAALFIIKEDPVFLFDIGRIDEVKRILEEVGRQNGAKINDIQLGMNKIDELFQKKMSSMENGLTNEDFNIRQIFRWDIMQAVLIIGLAGVFYQLAGQSMGLTIQNMQNSYNFNLFLLGLSGICGFFSAIYVGRIQPQRKRGLIVSSLLYGVLAMLFLFPFCYQSGGVETAVIFGLGVLLCWAGNFQTRLKVDSFPERYQMTIVGLIEAISTFGTLASPILVQASIDRSIDPIISVNILRILMGTLPLFIHTEQRIHLQQEEGSASDTPKGLKVLDTRI